MDKTYSVSGDPHDVVRALAEATTASLGDFPKPRYLGITVLIFARQIEALGQIDPAYLMALRLFVESRVRPLVPDDETMERVLTDPADPNHLYWVAVVPRSLLRKIVALKIRGEDAQKKVFSGMMFGPVRMPGPDSGEESEGQFDPSDLENR
jgi:hypothetical protein